MKEKTVNVKQLTICALFTALTAVGAFLKIPMPLCPITLQFLFTNLAGLILGKRLACASVGAYVVIGLLGLPIFTSGGGIGYIFQPTFGFLVMFVVGATVAGWFVETFGAGKWQWFTASIINLIIVFVFGTMYYVLITNYYLGSGKDVFQMIVACALLPLPGDILLCILSTFVLKRIAPAISSFWTVAGYNKKAVN